MAIVSSNAASKRPKSESVPDRVVDGARQVGDDCDPGRAAGKDDSLRPKRLADYIGQRELKQVLGIAVKAAVGRGESLDHVLLYGPPGLGKTTMAMVLAEELGVNCRITSAPALERPRDIVGLLVTLQPKDLLFIDEIHRLSRVAEELLYPAMEDRRLDLTVGKGSTARTRALDLPPFTLVGATTRAGALSSPLRDRFGLIQRLEFYGLEVCRRSWNGPLACWILNSVRKPAARSLAVVGAHPALPTAFCAGCVMWPAYGPVRAALIGTWWMRP